MQHRHLLIALSTRQDERGRITIAQDGDHIPFPVGRLFVLDKIPPDALRGNHAHRSQHELLVMVRGSCHALIDDGRNQSRILLEPNGEALYVPPMHWLELSDFSDDAICNVLASGHYDRAGYIWNIDEFRAAAAAGD